MISIVDIFHKTAKTYYQVTNIHNFPKHEQILDHDLFYDAWWFFRNNPLSCLVTIPEKLTLHKKTGSDIVLIPEFHPDSRLAINKRQSGKYIEINKTLEETITMCELANGDSGLGNTAFRCKIVQIIIQSFINSLKTLIKE